jgi:protein SCO1/2
MFSVDPERDTPQALAAYAQRYGADPRWVLATGPRPALVSLCRDGFHLSVGQGTSAREPIAHSVRLALVDPAGRIRGFYAADDAAAMSRLRADARRLLQELRT